MLQVRLGCGKHGAVHLAWMLGTVACQSVERVSWDVQPGNLRLHIQHRIQDVALRQRAKRLLEAQASTCFEQPSPDDVIPQLAEAIRRIPLVYYDIKAWENEHEKVFSLFRKGGTRK